MKTYLVGGAVRDLLLGVEAKDRDYVVTGATVEQMLSAGFQQVGKSFPVFLHPESKCEYALARIERKNGHGYGGFTFDFSPGKYAQEASDEKISFSASSLHADSRNRPL